MFKYQTTVVKNPAVCMCVCVWFFQESSMQLEVMMERPDNVWAQWKLTTQKATRGATSLRWAQDAVEQVCVHV